MISLHIFCFESYKPYFPQFSILYSIIQVLFNEASLVKLQMRMLQDGNVRRYRSTKYQRLQKRVEQIWEELLDEAKTQRSK